MRHRKRGSIESVILGGISIGLLFFILAPIVFLVFISFSSGETLRFPPPGWGVRWYQSAFDLLVGRAWRVERFAESLLTSVAIAVSVMFLSVVAGVPASYALVRYRFKGKMFIEQLVTLPLVFPLIVLGVSLLVLVSRFEIEAVFWRIVTAHVIITVPFVVRNCTASLHGISPTLEEAGRTLGANWFRTFWEIVIPLMRPGILSGMLIAFIVSFNEFTVSFFLYTMDIFPFPIWLFSRAVSSIDLKIFAISSGVIALDVVLIFVLDRVLGGQAGVSL